MLMDDDYDGEDDGCEHRSTDAASRSLYTPRGTSACRDDRATHNLRVTIVVITMVVKVVLPYTA